MERVWSVGFVLVGIAALAVGAAMLIARPSRPVARGEVGLLEVYGQLPDGPQRLFPGRERPLPRPQDIAFRLSVAGTGPRLVRIEVVTDEDRTIAYEAQHYAPADQAALDYVLELPETAPDRLDVVTTIEAPHRTSVSSVFPIRLMGPSRRFWEP